MSYTHVGNVSDDNNNVLDSRMTLKYKFRFFGTSIILLAAFIFNGSVVPEKLSPPTYDPVNLNEAQTEMEARILEQKKSWVTVVEMDGGIAYLFNNRRQEWTYDRPDWLDDNNQPILSESEKMSIAEKAVIELGKIPAWLNLEEPISYNSYNDTLINLKMLVWMGLAFSLSFYITVFHRHRPREESGWGWATYFGTPFMLLLLLGSYLGSSQPWLCLVPFGASFLSMFLLWALTRAPEKLTKPEQAPVEENEKPAC